jgi:hypothetical protein
MAAIALSGLAVTPGFGQSFLEWTVDDPNWNGLERLRLDKVELWAATSNDRAGASKVAEGLTSTIHRFTDGAARYYWIKPLNRAGLYGDWFPTSATGGVAAAANASIGGSSGYTKLPNGLIEQWGVGTFTTGLCAITFPTAFPHACLQINAMDDAGTTDSGSGVSQISIGIYVAPTTTGVTLIGVVTQFVKSPPALSSAGLMNGSNCRWRALGY